MIDVFRIADILAEDVKRRYSDDIAIVAYYGSYATGTANNKSDLDFFFIPTRPNWWDACFTFILDDIGYDFWPISWERAEGLAEFNESMVSIIADSRVLYHRNEDDLARFNALKNKIALMRTPDRKGNLLNKAMNRLRNSYGHLFNMSLPEAEGNLAVSRVEAGRVVASVLDAIALINQTYLKRGIGQNFNQVLSMGIRPNNFEEILRSIGQASQPCEIKRLCEMLIIETRKCLLAEQRGAKSQISYNEQFTGCFEEVKSSFNKIISACEKEDWDTAFYTSLRTQNEMNEFIARVEEGIEYTDFNTFNEHRASGDNIGLPDLAGKMHCGDFASLKDMVVKFEAAFRKHLESKGVAIREFAALDEFEAYVRSR